MEDASSLEKDINEEACIEGSSALWRVICRKYIDGKGIHSRKGHSRCVWVQGTVSQVEDLAGGEDSTGSS